MGVHMKVKKAKAAVTVNPSVLGNVCLITYRYQHTQQTLEEVLDSSARYMHGRNWDKYQMADLLVIGTNRNGKKYILNEPSEFALAKLQEEYGKRKIPAVKRIGNHEIIDVVVRNMLLDDIEESQVLRGPVSEARSRKGYIQIYPEKLEINTQELKPLMDELIKLRMLRLNTPGLKWLRSKF